MADTIAATLTCHVCGYPGLDDGCDGFFYCRRCGSQAQDIVETGLGDEDFLQMGSSAPVYLASQRRTQPTLKTVKAEPISQSQSFYHSLSQTFEETAVPVKKEKQSFEDRDHDNVPDSVGPVEPSDFGSGKMILRDEDYYVEVRMRYVMGVQLMIQYQCEALVEKFKVSPLICGIAGSIWLRFVASTGVFADKWAEDAMLESEKQGKREYKEDPKYYGCEPRNAYNKRMVLVWCNDLQKKLPLSCSLSISFLACHVAREPILPTDIQRWAEEGKLRYLSAYVEIEKYIGRPSRACPLAASEMFRPSRSVQLVKLESLAASIAERIGLSLPPVNFYAIASRYLRQLSLPVEKILPYACRLFDWSMPPDLWLSANELRFPTRVCVMSIIIVAIRILYNINGLGKWEMTLDALGDSSYLKDELGNLGLKDEADIKTSAETETASQDLADLDGEPGRNLSSTHKFEPEATELLCELKRFDDVNYKPEYTDDLPAYLQYCRDVVFSGLKPLVDDYTEEKVIQKLWDYYLHSLKDTAAAEESDIDLNHKRRRVDTTSDYMSRNERETAGLDETAIRQSDEFGAFEENSNPRRSEDAEEQKSRTANDTRAVEIKVMKSSMEENRFFYIPPRENVKSNEYLHYVRKKDGILHYIAHADYYILLRACAKAVQVDVRNMHSGVLSLERRLDWIENRIAHCLHKKPSQIYCTKEVSEDPSRQSQ